MIYSWGYFTGLKDRQPKKIPGHSLNKRFQTFPLGFAPVILHEEHVLPSVIDYVRFILQKVRFSGTAKMYRFVPCNHFPLSRSFTYACGLDISTPKGQCNSWAVSSECNPRLSLFIIDQRRAEREKEEAVPAAALDTHMASILEVGIQLVLKDKHAVSI